MFVNSMPSDVSWFSSQQLGAPQMNGGSNGDMLRVLDACLVSGLPEKIVDSVVIDSNLVTLGFGVGHNMLAGQIIEITGATDSSINGKHRINSATNNTLTITVVGATSSGGSVKARLPSLGWESIFGSTDPLKRAYRSKSPNSAKRVLFLDMSIPSAGASTYSATNPAKRAMVSVCEDMQVLGQQIGSITDSINNYAANPNGSLIWNQKRASTATKAVTNTVTRWKLVGNSEFFFFIIGWNNEPVFDTTNFSDCFGFGEFSGLGQSSQDKTFLMALNVPTESQVYYVGNLGAPVNSYAFCFVGGVFTKCQISPIIIPSAGIFLVSGAGINKMSYPNIYGNSLLATACKLYDQNGNIVGVLPTMLFVENKITDSQDSQVIDGVLLVDVQEQASPTSARLATLGFYLGG